jgi:hypothetical protein
MRKTAALIVLSISWLTASVSPAQNDKDKRRVEVEILTLHAHTVEPKAIQRPEGPFFLTVINQSGFQEPSFELHNAANRGAKVLEKHLKKGMPRFTELLDLPAGEYILTEVTHPQWTCRIVLLGKNTK